MDMHVFQSPEDLLADDSFLAWVHRSDPVVVQRWQDALDRDPTVKALAEEAVILLQQLDFHEAAVPEAQVRAAEERLFLRLEQTADQAPKGGRVIRLKSWRTWASAAACVFVLLLAGWLDKNWIHEKKTLTTPYGHISQVTLPDGTEVTLNAHSSLTYRRKMKEGKDREVWLTGEAFLHVEKTPSHDRFIVHTVHFDVIVYGTRFDVSSLDDGPGVVLQEGSVVVHSCKGEEVKMQPGDMVRYEGTKLVRQTVHPEDVVAWTALKVVFQNATLDDVVHMIDQHYGVKVRVESPSLLNLPVNGMMPNDNLEVLLKALAMANNLNIQREGEQVVIR